MRRRQFLIGLAAVALVPAPAFARRRGGGFRFRSGTGSDDDSRSTPAERRRKMWLGIGVASIVGLVVVGKLAFWVMRRLEQNPAPRRRHQEFYPSQASPIKSQSSASHATAGAQPAALPMASARRATTAASFGKRTF